MRRLRLRAEQAERLQATLAVTAEHAVELQQSVQEATTRAEQVKARRTGAVH
jgi:hypothetical protein